MKQELLLCLVYRREKENLKFRESITSHTVDSVHLTTMQQP